ncbi:MAG: hypothetical protein IT381_17875 [Deltaproteobacteria bacterium]|nr:hypothetical protein [Deltaproteobacteria bacterium]
MPKRVLFGVAVATATLVIGAGSAGAESTLAVLPLQTKGAVDSAVVQKLAHALDEALATQTELKVFSGKALHKKIGDPSCGTDAACLGALGRKAQTAQVLLGIIGAGGKKIDFHLVASTEGTLVQRTEVALDGDDPKQQLKDAIGRVLATDAAEMPALQAVMPTKKKSAESAEPALEPVAVGPAKRSRALLIVGIALAAVGAGGMATGAYFGVRHDQLGASVSDTTTQTAMARIERDANQAGLIANLGMGIGGGFVVAGVALIVLDVVFDMRAKATLNVSSNGASAGVVLPW